jgi:hypothetical protein
MDEAVRHVRHHASRELGDRRGAKRRYSAPLRQAAVAYWREQEHGGETVAQVAQRLGVAPRACAGGRRMSASTRCTWSLTRPRVGGHPRRRRPGGIAPPVTRLLRSRRRGTARRYD